MMLPEQPLTQHPSMLAYEPLAPGEKPDLKRQLMEYMCQRENQLAPSSIKQMLPGWRRYCEFIQNHPEANRPGIERTYLTKLRSTNIGSQRLTFLMQMAIEFARWQKQMGYAENYWPLRLRLMGLPNAQRKRPVTHEEFVKLYHFVKTDGRPKWAWLPDALMIARYTGLRISDICLLKWSHIYFDEERIRMYPKKGTYFAQELCIPISRHLLKRLMEMWPERKGEFVNPEIAADYIKYRSAYVAFTALDTALTTAEMRKFTWHSFRHAFVTGLFEAGFGWADVSAITGQSFSTIQIYAHCSAVRAVAAVDSIPGITEPPMAKPCAPNDVNQGDTNASK